MAKLGTMENPFPYPTTPAERQAATLRHLEWLHGPRNERNPVYRKPDGTTHYWERAGSIDAKTGEIKYGGRRFAGKYANNAKRADRVSGQSWTLEDFRTVLAEEYGSGPKTNAMAKTRYNEYLKELTDIKDKTQKAGPMFTRGHIDAAKHGGLEIPENLRLERGPGPGGNFSRGANDEPSKKATEALGLSKDKTTALKRRLGLGEGQVIGEGLTPKDTKAILDGADPDAVKRNRLKINANIEKNLGKRLGKRLGRYLPGVTGTAFDALEVAERTARAAATGNPLDAIQAGVSVATTALGATGVGEVVAMPLQIANDLTDVGRGLFSSMMGKPPEKPPGRPRRRPKLP